MRPDWISPTRWPKVAHTRRKGIEAAYKQDIASGRTPTPASTASEHLVEWTQDALAEHSRSRATKQLNLTVFHASGLQDHQQTALRDNPADAAAQAGSRQTSYIHAHPWKQLSLPVQAKQADPPLKNTTNEHIWTREDANASHFVTLPTWDGVYRRQTLAVQTGLLIEDLSDTNPCWAQSFHGPHPARRASARTHALLRV